MYANEEYYIVKTKEGIHFWPISSIVRLQAARSYTDVHFNDGTKQTVSREMAWHLKQLKRFGCFFKLHRSHVVNIRFVDFITRENWVKLKNELKLPSSSEHIARLLRFIRGRKK